MTKQVREMVDDGLLPTERRTMFLGVLAMLKSKNSRKETCCLSRSWLEVLTSGHLAPALIPWLSWEVLGLRAPPLWQVLLSPELSGLWSVAAQGMEPWCLFCAGGGWSRGAAHLLRGMGR